jgi:hypothetical protein
MRAGRRHRTSSAGFTPTVQEDMGPPRLCGSHCLPGTTWKSPSSSGRASVTPPRKSLVATICGAQSPGSRIWAPAWPVASVEFAAIEKREAGCQQASSGKEVRELRPGCSFAVIRQTPLIQREDRWNGFLSHVVGTAHVSQHL